MKAIKAVLMAIWGLLTLAEQKADDEECGVDLGGQGRNSWKQS